MFTKILNAFADDHRPTKEEYYFNRKCRKWAARMSLGFMAALMIAIGHCAFAQEIVGEKTLTNPKHHDMTQEAAGKYKLFYTPPAGGKTVVLHFTCGLYDNYDANQIMQSHTRKVITGSLTRHFDKPNRLCYTDNVIPGKTSQGDRYVSGWPEVE